MSGPPPVPPTTPWYRDRNRQLVGDRGAVVAGALIAWFMVTSGQRKEEFAARSLNQARSAAEAGNLPLASSELQKLIRTYKGTDAATEAVITLNQVRMVNGQSELAAVGLRDFLATKPAPEYAAPAYGLLGAALENARKFDEAGDAFMSRLQDGRAGVSQGSLSAGRGAGPTGRRQDAGGHRGLPGDHPEVSQDVEHDRGAGPAGGDDRRQDVAAGSADGEVGISPLMFLTPGSPMARRPCVFPYILGHRRVAAAHRAPGGTLNLGTGPMHRRQVLAAALVGVVAQGSGRSRRKPDLSA